jgi:hypothetical protein|tara:strand:+ start:1099 stop:1452 length:354 start_codon:yes stop_codon:yes gene_type:complete
MSKQEPKIGDKVLCFDDKIYYDGYMKKSWRDVWYISVITNIYSEGEDTPYGSGDKIEYEMINETGEGEHRFLGAGLTSFVFRDKTGKNPLKPLGFDSQGVTNLWIFSHELKNLHNSK